jgi:predicted kinase
VQKIILTVGIPASSKSTWAKAEVAKDPSNWVRINNDDLQSMCNGSVWSADYEKIIGETRKFLIREALKRGKSVIIDNLNIGKRNWEDACKIAKALNIDVQLMEKSFFIDLETAIERDSTRGSASVGAEVIKVWWKKSGGKQHAHYKPRIEIYKKGFMASNNQVAMVQDESAQKAIIVDLDGTYALIGDRSPYDAERCDVVDFPNQPIVDTVKLFHDAGYKIIFCSGRMEKHREASIRFIEKYSNNITYELFMRQTDDMRKDVIIKEEIFRNKIEGKFNIKLVLDDRSTVVDGWRQLGLTCLQVAPGNF